MSDNNLEGNIRSENESDRSGEFKESRTRLISKVNSWLNALSKKRDTGEPLSDGRIVSDKSIITRTDLGRSGPFTRSFQEGMRKGLSLAGDGLEKPFMFQMVRNGSSPDAREITEITGSDPLAVSVYGDTYDLRRQSEILAEFGVRDIESDGKERYFRFTVSGDGKLARHFLGLDGVHTSVHVRELEDIELAHAAFDEIAVAIFDQSEV